MGIRHANRFEELPLVGPARARHLRRYPVKSGDGASTLRKIARGLSGLPAAGSGSGPFCCPCLHCYLGTTPKSWTITATGITYISNSNCGCINWNQSISQEGGTIFSMPTLSWNSTFTLDSYSEGTQLGCNCQWTSSYRDSVSFFFGGGPNCGSVQPFSASSAFHWIIGRSATEWVLALVADQAIPGTGIGIPIFSSTLAMDPKDGDCESTLTFTNQLVDCPVHGPLVDGMGLSTTGTVVCTPNP